ncbi:hypothetical protein PRIC1_000158 [Phytophthora ramorum]|uniref:Myb/SANT-like domain-containing protein n=1 Tax=Phytophthora ramorum TaxID=164328 RepID=H3GDZ6_PHYRM|nr:hypothetical protein KRP23_10790 [Phytophthora ramorum]KAH7497044.1 hypothetical protein KRP22_13596 [Phytophthora ramorum]
MSLFSAPLEEGLAFDTGPEGVFAVQDYALSTNKAVRVERASGADRRLVCASEQPCGFFVQIYRQRLQAKKYGKWYIASMQLAHSETCDSKGRLTTRQIAELPAFMAAVQASPKASIESLVALMLERHGMSLERQVRLVYRARDLVRNGKAVVRNNFLLSQDAPLPTRQFVHRPVKKDPSETKKPKNLDRMAWTDILIESLLIERIVKHGAQFIEAGHQSQHRELWDIIQKEFNEMHDVTVTVPQLRAKFRYLRDQYLRARADEEEAARDTDKLVIYPRCWDMLAEYFGDVPRSSPGVDVNNEEVIEAEPATNQAIQSAPVSILSVPFQQALVQPVPFQSTPVQAVPMQSDTMQIIPAQPSPVYSPPQAQLPVTQQTSSPARSDAASKRRRLTLEASVLQPESRLGAFNPAPAAVPPVSSDVAVKLETIQSTQREMARSMEGMKQLVEQSNEAIRSLQQALNQSNQVNAALLDFLRRQPGV